MGRWSVEDSCSFKILLWILSLIWWAKSFEIWSSRMKALLLCLLKTKGVYVLETAWRVYNVRISGLGALYFFSIR